MKRNWMKLATVAALAAGIALAQTPPTNPETRPTHRQRTYRGKSAGHMFRALNLTDAQKLQAKAIFSESRKANEPLRLQLQQNRQAFRAALKSNDQGQIANLSRASSELRGQLKAARTQTMEKFFQILTPEQRAKAEKMQVRLQRHSGRHGQGNHVGYLQRREAVAHANRWRPAGQTAGPARFFSRWNENCQSMPRCCVLRLLEPVWA